MSGLKSEGRRARQINEAFGKVLRNLRESRSMTQERLSFDSGYHRTYISLLERGLKNPSLEALIRLSGTLGVPASNLVRRIERTMQSRSGPNR